MSLGSGVSGTSPFKGSPATRQPAFAAGHQARYPASYTESTGWRTGNALPLSCCLSAAGIGFLGVLFPPGNPAFLTVGLPAAPRRRSRTLTGFPRSAHMRCGRAGCPLYPGGDGVPSGHRDVRDRRLPPCSGWPLPPRYRSPTRDVRLTRHQQGFRVIHPSGLPLTCGTRPERAPSGFPLSFAPGRYQPRTSGQGRVPNTNPKSRPRHHAEPPIDETHSQRATSCRTVRICRVADLDWRLGRVYFLPFLNPSRGQPDPALTARSASLCNHR